MRNIFFRNSKRPCKVYLGPTKILEPEPSMQTIPLTLVATQANSTVGLQMLSNNATLTNLQFAPTQTYDQISNTLSVEVSLDNGTTFSSWDGHDITLANAGDSIQIRNSNENPSNPWPVAQNGREFINFKLSGKLIAKGNVGSLKYKNLANENVTNVIALMHSLFASNDALQSIEDLYLPKDWRYTNQTIQFMFANNSALEHSFKELPVVIGYNSARGTFINCSQLKDTPRIIANYQSNLNCYNAYASIFQNCIALSTITRPIDINSANNARVFNSMFSGCSELKDISNLTINISDVTQVIGNAAFANMFSGCSSLTSMHTFPLASKIYEYAFQNMFMNCYSLISAPDIPLNAESACTSIYTYEHMFMNCSSLISAPQFIHLSSTQPLSNYACHGMYQNCTSLVYPPSAIQVPTIGYYACESMFKNCTSLTASPMISTDEVGTCGCLEMFYGCSSLSTAQETLSAMTLNESAYKSMFDRCTSLKNAPNLPATTLASNCYRSMFYSCSNLESEGIKLPAATLCTDCYRYMFYGCSKLSCIDVDFTSWGTNNNQFTLGWVQNIKASGLFKCSGFLPEKRGTNNIPNGWTLYRKDIG